MKTNEGGAERGGGRVGSAWTFGRRQPTSAQRGLAFIREEMNLEKAFYSSSN